MDIVPYEKPQGVLKPDLIIDQTGINYILVNNKYEKQLLTFYHETITNLMNQFMAGFEEGLGKGVKWRQ